MVSEDSTSRVMVLPVTAREVSTCLSCDVAVRPAGYQLTSLDEDLHLVWCVVDVLWLIEMCLVMVLDGAVAEVDVLRVDGRRKGLQEEAEIFKGWQAATRQVAERLAPMTEASSPMHDSSRAR